MINQRLIPRFLAGIIFNNETAVESRNFMENEKIAGFGIHHIHFSSVSPPPSVESSSPFSPPTTDMSVVYLPRTVQGEIVIDNMQFTPDLANKSTAEFKTLASSIETEVIYRFIQNFIFICMMIMFHMFSAKKCSF